MLLPPPHQDDKGDKDFLVPCQDWKLMHWITWIFDREIRAQPLAVLRTTIFRAAEEEACPRRGFFTPIGAESNFIFILVRNLDAKLGAESNSQIVGFQNWIPHQTEDKILGAKENRQN